SEPVDRSPRGEPEWQAHVVFGEDRVASERRAFRIVRQQRLEIAIDVALQLGTRIERRARLPGRVVETGAGSFRGEGSREPRECQRRSAREQLTAINSDGRHALMGL